MTIEEEEYWLSRAQHRQIGSAIGGIADGVGISLFCAYRLVTDQVNKDEEQTAHMTDSGIQSRCHPSSSEADRGHGPASALSPPAARPLAPRRRRDTVAVILFSNGPMFESAVPISVFGVDRRDAGVPHYRLLVCAGEPGQLPTTAGLRLAAPYGLEATERAGTVIVPTWRAPGETPPEPVLAALRRAHHEGARIVGLCAGAFVLAAAGLLEGRPATTHWMYAPALAKRYPRVRVDPRELYIDDGDLLTSAGTAAGIDLCLHLVRTDHGPGVANALARRLVVPAHRSGGQAQYIDHALPEEIVGDPLAEVIAWALDHVGEDIDVDAMAARAYMSRRTFDRHFRTLTGSAPLQWLLTQRVLRAQRLLETTELSVEDVAQCSGFRSPVALRGHFRRLLGISPATYRDSFHSGELPLTRMPGDPRNAAAAMARALSSAPAPVPMQMSRTTAPAAPATFVAAPGPYSLTEPRGARRQGKRSTGRGAPPAHTSGDAEADRAVG